MGSENASLPQKFSRSSTSFSSFRCQNREPKKFSIFYDFYEGLPCSGSCIVLASLWVRLFGLKMLFIGELCCNFFALGVHSIYGMGRILDGDDHTNIATS